MDRYDVISLLGLGLSAYGLWLVWPPGAAIWPGFVLTILGVIGSSKGSGYGPAQ